MNIFVVDLNPAHAAIDLPDKLIVKMPTESAQMLAHWAHAIHNTPIPKADGTPHVIKPSILAHPCTKWLYSDSNHVWWLINHANALCNEYTYRYTKSHGARNAIFCAHELFTKMGHPRNHKDISYFELAMPDQYKIPSNPVQSYRNYMMNEKGYAEWKHTLTPGWWDHGIHAPVRQKYLIDRELKKLAKRTRATSI